MSTCIIHMYRHIFNRIYIIYNFHAGFFIAYYIRYIFQCLQKVFENILLNFTCQNLLNQFPIVRHLIILLFATGGSSPLYKYFVFLWTSLMISPRLNNTFHVLFLLPLCLPKWLYLFTLQDAKWYFHCWERIFSKKFLPTKWKGESMLLFEIPSLLTWIF